jgi:hypothetical protein
VFLQFNLNKIDPRIRSTVEELVQRRDSYPQPLVKLAQAQVLLGGISGATLLRRVQSGELQTVIVGGLKMIPTSQIFDLLIKDAIASYPLGEEPAKVRTVPTAFKKRKRRRRSVPLTDAERRGLEQGNQGRHEEALRRRAEAEAASS